MKDEIHPTYYPDAKVTCASCGTTWTTGSTKKESASTSAPTATRSSRGEAQRILDIEGQVDRFYKKLSARQTYVEAEGQRGCQEVAGAPDRGTGPDARAPPRHLRRRASPKSSQFMEAGSGRCECPGDRRLWSEIADRCEEEAARAFGYELPEARLKKRQRKRNPKENNNSDTREAEVRYRASVSCFIMHSAGMRRCVATSTALKTIGGIIHERCNLR